MILRDLVGETRRRMAPRLSAIVPPEQWTDLRHRVGRFHPWESGFDLSPPAVPPGETVGPPDYVGVGAPLAGIRWWAGLVAEHPDVTSHAGLGTGRHFLSHFATRRFGDEDIRRYHGWFPRRPGTITGEWTPTYLGDPWVPHLLSRAAPDARVIVLVREPIDRLRLGLDHTRDRRQSNAGAHMAESIDRSFYAEPLCRWLGRYPADRVLVLQHERCLREPAAAMAETYRFLGLDDRYRPPSLDLPHRAVRLAPLDPGSEERLIDLYAQDVVDLATLVPTFDVSLWPRFSSAAG